MLKCNLLLPVLSQWSKTFIRTSSLNAESNSNAIMNDKLYKMVQLEMKSAEPAVLRSYETFILTAAKHLDVNVGRRWWYKPSKKRWTLLKSVFIYKKHMVQYEVRTHYLWIQLVKLTGSTADTFLEYVERMLPEGVSLKVTKFSLEPLPEHLKPDNIRKVLKEANFNINENQTHVREEQPIKLEHP